MGTRSRIGYHDSNQGTIESSYCHWDGYPEGVGAILKEHYTDVETVKELLSHGDMSTLGKTTQPAPPRKPDDDDDAPNDNYCTFYHRDNGEPKEQTSSHAINATEFWDYFKGDDTEFLYVFESRNKQWTTYAHDMVDESYKKLA